MGDVHDRDYVLQYPDGEVRVATGSRVTLGRGSGADVVLYRRSVARMHAALRVDGSGPRIEDLSEQGILVNGEPVSGEARLSPDDEIEIGGVPVRLRLAEPTSPDIPAVTLPPDGNSNLLGRKVADQYMVTGLLGEGGMGRVYHAEQLSLGRAVALKVVHPHLLTDHDIARRFYIEARAASRLNHPKSVSVIDFGETRDGILYLAMEYVEGEALDEVALPGEPLDPLRACAICAGVLEALQAAHDLGIVHRDIKPGNIIVKPMRRGQETVKVVDFGLAQVMDSENTEKGGICGTPEYMSPEQCVGEAIDPRTDLYAVGVVLFEIVTGELPYDAEQPIALLMSHVNDPIPDPRIHCEVPEDLVAVITKALQKKRVDRYQDATEFAEALGVVMRRLRSRSSGVACSKCGTLAQVGTAFCGSCGNPLGVFETPTAKVRRQKRVLHRPKSLEVLSAFRRAAGAREIRLVGAPGMGKSHLLERLAEEARADGDLAISVGPHASGAPVPLHALRELTAALHGASLEEMLASSEPALANPLVRAGLRELAAPKGTLQPVGGAALDAVAYALAQVIRTALRKHETSRALLMFDDLDRCDGLTEDILGRLPGLLGQSDVCVIAAQRRAAPEAVEVVGLEPLTADQAATVLEDELGLTKVSTTAPITPLYIDQLHALGIASAAEVLPKSTAEAIQQRLDPLDVSSRRLLQALAVMGDRSDVSALDGLVEREDLDALDSLVARGLVIVDDAEARFSSPLIRDHVEASTPAQTRRDLHARALAVESGRGAPLEVRAMHAYGSGEPDTALLLLGAMGDAASRRGDHVSASLAYRWTLSLARREMLRTGEESYESTTLRAAACLAGSLRDLDQLLEAEGVAMEALGVAGSKGAECALLLLERASIDVARGERTGARRWFGRALFVASDLSSPRVPAKIDLAYGRFLRDVGELGEAADAIARAVEGLGGDEGAAARLELAELFVRLGMLDEAEARCAMADTSPLLAGRAAGTRGLVRAARGDQYGAAESFRLALDLAEGAGDWDGAIRWRAALAG